MAVLIWATVFPAATAFSIKASEIAELLPKAKRSFVKGTPNLDASSFTFSWDAFSSADSDTCTAAWTGAATGAFDLILCFAKTWAVTWAALFSGGAVKSEEPTEASNSVYEAPWASFC